MVDFQMKPVFSSHVDAVGYDAASQELHVQFTNGKIAVYQGVPQRTAEKVTKAASIGGALNEHIRGQYDHRYR